MKSALPFNGLRARFQIDKALAGPGEVWWEIERTLQRNERPTRAEVMKAMRAAGVPPALGPAVAQLLERSDAGGKRGRPELSLRERLERADAEWQVYLAVIRAWTEQPHVTQTQAFAGAQQSLAEKGRHLAAATVRDTFKRVRRHLAKNVAPETREAWRKFELALRGGFVSWPE